MVLVDAGPWIAMLSQRDQHAHEAQSRYRELVKNGTRLVTTNYVVSEAATRIRYGAGADAALAFRRMLNEANAERRLHIEWIDRELEYDAWGLLGQYRDVPLSLTDATTAAVARRIGVTEIFGFDQDFEALGFVVLPGQRRRRRS